MTCPPSFPALIVVALAFGSALPAANAFSIAPLVAPSSTSTTTCSTTTTPTRLNLVPEQGNQLAAAFNAASAAEKPKETSLTEVSDQHEHESHSPFGAAVTTTTPSPKQQQQQQQLHTKDEKSIRIMTASAPTTTTTATTTKSSSSSKAKAFVSRIFSLPGAIMGRHPAAAPALVDIPRERLGRSTESEDVVLYPLVGFQFYGSEDGTTKVLPTTPNPACRISTLPGQELYGWYCTACTLDSIYSDTYCDEPIAAPAAAVTLMELEQQLAADSDGAAP